MTRRQGMDAAVLIAATAVTRFVFRSHRLYDIDSVNFALALKRFDPSVHQPHPPGYFLYVCLGRLAGILFQDANASLVAISIVFSCGAVAMIYMLADDWFGRNAAVFAGLIFVFSPLAWFHGTVALTYTAEAFFSALTGHLCWRIYRGASRFIPAGAVAVGIAAGFRPSSLLLLAPLLLFSLRNASGRRAAGGIGALALTLLAWFLPMIRISGEAAYISSFASLWLAVPSKGTVFNSSPATSLARAAVVLGIYLLSFGCAAILPVLKSAGDCGAVSCGATRPRVLFTRVWVMPGLLFFVFIYLKFVNSGYLLALEPPVCVWMGCWASRWYGNLGFGQSTKTLLIGACAAANAMIFVFAPVYCSHRAVLRFESELEHITAAVPQIASPREALIVGFDSHFLGYRHAGYYLPGYLTVQFPEVRLTSGTKVFAMQHRDTQVETALPATSAPEFIIFPLPLGDREYRDYADRVRERLPVGDLRTVVRGGHEYTIGPVADLPLLFPNAGNREAAERTVPW
jgi:transmembrane protein TMEM260 (protein O-mannosyltransferase)